MTLSNGEHPRSNGEHPRSNGEHPSRRALILDFDGVVVETEQLNFDCWNAAFKERYGIEVAGSYHQLVGLSLEEIYSLWSQAESETRLELTSQDKDELLARKTELYYELGPSILEPMPGLLELVNWAQHHQWYVTIASRARRMRLLYTLAILKIPIAVDLIMGTEDVVDVATDKKIHTRTVEPFGIPPANCVVIEDSASGVHSAKRCRPGTVIGLTTSLTEDALRQAGADHVVDSLDEVIRFLKLGMGKEKLHQ